MTFKNIFDFARNVSHLGSNAETQVTDYIPDIPNEMISVPPHDPWKPVEMVQQDPKIVRETSPEALVMFNLIGGINASIDNSANKVEVEISDPMSVINPAQQVMMEGQEITKPLTDDVTTTTKNPDNPQP